MNALSICNTNIRQLDGLYSLNDLHVASGLDAKHKPANFIRLDQTKELCIEIERCSDVSIKAISTIRGRGKQQGTYGCKEIVYAYAMWISPAFMLQVIRAYDSLVAQPPMQGDSYLPQIMAKASNTACAIAGHIASEMAKQVHNINFTHRFIVMADNDKVTIRNIEDMNLVNIVHVRKVRQDIRTVNKALQELLHRTRILEGEISPKDMDLPLVCSV